MWADKIQTRHKEREGEGGAHTSSNIIRHTLQTDRIQKREKELVRTRTTHRSHIAKKMILKNKREKKTTRNTRKEEAGLRSLTAAWLWTYLATPRNQLSEKADYRACDHGKRMTSMSLLDASVASLPVNVVERSDSPLIVERTARPVGFTASNEVQSTRTHMPGVEERRLTGPSLPCSACIPP